MKRKLGEILTELGVVNEHQLQAALEHQRRFKDKLKLGASLVALGFVTEEKLTQVLSHYLNIPLVDLNLEFISPDIIELVPAEIAEKYHVLPFRIFEENRKKILGLAMADPTNLEPIDTVQFQTSLNIRPYVAAPSDVERAIQRYYHGLLLDGISYVGAYPQADSLSTPGIKIISRGNEITWNGQALPPSAAPPRQPLAPSPFATASPQRVSTERAAPEGAVAMNEMLRLLHETNAMMRVLVKKGIITQDEVNREAQGRVENPGNANPDPTQEPKKK